MNIYVLPTEEGKPPRAVLFEGEIGEIGDEIKGAMATWSNDNGAWMLGDIPAPPELGEAITNHARNLGVEAFLD